MYDTPSARWAAVTARHPSSANAFIYGVVTTGIFCRPTCSARLARRSNVRFFDSVAEARTAGLRPCKRCKPDQAHEEDERHLRGKLAARACELIEAREGRITAAKAAEELGVSPRHLYAVFRGVKGVSPGKFAEGVRARANGRMETMVEQQPCTGVDTSNSMSPSMVPDLTPDFDVDMSWLREWDQSLVADATTNDPWWHPDSLRPGTFSPPTPSDSAGFTALESSTWWTDVPGTEKPTLYSQDGLFASSEDYATLLSSEMIEDIDRTLEEVSGQKLVS